jgi:hypothetical protein
MDERSLTILDERGTWKIPLFDVAKARGYKPLVIDAGKYSRTRTGLGFFRPHAQPQRLKQNKTIDWPIMRERLTMIQDDAQVEVYDNKSEQKRRWGTFMPPTWRFTNMGEAEAFVEGYGGILVSKSDVGASSVNVHILKTKQEQLDHVRRVFTHGITQNHCCGGGNSKSALSTQHGYVLLQEHIPHEVTWRVNAVGTLRAVFKRFNYPDRGVAQTGNVEPVMKLDEQTEWLLGYADEVFATIGSKWCALDILFDSNHQNWLLLETSLAWPWPSPGQCMLAPFFGSRRVWAGMWDAMLDEYEAGVWGSND